MTDETKIANEHNPELKHKSLLSKYEIPLDHVSYEYIRDCNDIKKLERIVKILKSGEEGHFPDLQKTAEERLRCLSPNNRHLRTEVPALNRSCFNKKEWGNILDDIENWKKEVSERDKQLYKVDDCDAPVGLHLPPVREPLLAKQPSGGSENKPKSRNKISDYAFWDKYDVDTELLKLDIEQERKKVSGDKKKITKQTEKDRLELVVNEAKTCSDVERQILAEQEKVRGNEYYQANDYVEAEKYYTASLAIFPTAKAYNNRASCYLKQGKYSAAVQDADSTLELEPNNVKALFRKGLALKHMSKFRESLGTMDTLLGQEPNSVQARNMVKQLTEKIDAEMETSDNEMGNEKTQDKSNSYNENRHRPESCFEVNEWGLPKVVCQCFGRLKFNDGQHKLNPRTPQITSLPVRNRGAENKRENVRIIELPDEYEQPKKKNSTKLEIVEIEKPPHEPFESICRPKKCNVVDKRTQKAGFTRGGGDVI